MNEYNISNLKIEILEFELSFDKSKNIAIFTTVEPKYNLKNIYSESITFKIVQKPFFETLGLNFIESNSLKIKIQSIFDKESLKIFAVYKNENEILILSSIDFITIKNSILYKHINNKKNKI